MGARKDVGMGSKKIGSLIKRRYSPGGYRHIPEVLDEKGLPKHRAAGFHVCKEAWVWIGYGGGKAQYLAGDKRFNGTGGSQGGTGISANSTLGSKYRCHGHALDHQVDAGLPRRRRVGEPA